MCCHTYKKGREKNGTNVAAVLLKVEWYDSGLRFVSSHEGATFNISSSPTCVVHPPHPPPTSAFAEYF